MARQDKTPSSPNAIERGLLHIGAAWALDPGQKIQRWQHRLSGLRPIKRYRVQ
jgi:hypothetical protein